MYKKAILIFIFAILLITGVKLITSITFFTSIDKNDSNYIQIGKLRPPEIKFGMGDMELVIYKYDVSNKQTANSYEEWLKKASYSVMNKYLGVNNITNDYVVRIPNSSDKHSKSVDYVALFYIKNFDPTKHISPKHIKLTVTTERHVRRLEPYDLARYMNEFTYSYKTKKMDVASPMDNITCVIIDLDPFLNTMVNDRRINIKLESNLGNATIKLK